MARSNVLNSHSAADTELYAQSTFRVVEIGNSASLLVKLGGFEDRSKLNVIPASTTVQAGPQSIVHVEGEAWIDVRLVWKRRSSPALSASVRWLNVWNVSRVQLVPTETIKLLSQ